MKLTHACACLIACIVSFSALADPPATNLTPNLTVGLQFGGAAHRDDALRFTALFDLRSQMFRRTSEIPQRATDAAASIANVAAGIPLVSVFELGVNRTGVDLAHVLGADMLAKSDQLNEDGDSHWYSHKWIWWTAGAVVATGAALAAASGGHDDNSGGTTGGGGSGNCSTVSGTTLVPPSSDLQVNPTCGVTP
jgi:hypothetical protein